VNVPNSRGFVASWATQPLKVLAGSDIVSWGCGANSAARSWIEFVNCLCENFEIL
jgi:hypothetical protein